ncbi:TIGR02391 family protein [Candidatus Poriferisodalis sp.]|uniref:TIGR02391 family protein n=1 Tax=Candidatus Poriferisodalis sp. TaxID=3101277 RepID=UPI003B015D85
MPELDIDEAQRTVSEFLQVLNVNKSVDDAYSIHDMNSQSTSPRDHPSHSGLLRLQPLIEQIAGVVDPDEPRDRFKPQGQFWQWDTASEAAERLAGILSQADRREAIFPTRGPALRAVGLHGWVWDAARGRWDDGYFRDAVHAAAEAVQQKTRVRLERRDLSGKSVYEQAFSLDEASEANPRLRLTVVDEEDAESWRSAHLGAMHLGIAVTAGIRNLSGHHAVELSEQEALEQLAALSVLARWVDSSKRHPQSIEA